MEYKVKSKLTEKKGRFPLSSKKFSEANAEADVKEKKIHPKGYEKLKKIEKKLKPKEILAHINKKGKVYVSKKVPKTLRKEVIEHDVNEKSFIERKRKK